MTNKITCVVNDISLENKDLKCEHGLSFWLETGSGKVLFDTGQTSRVLEHNLKVLDLDHHQIDAIALSHAHYDHTGGLEWIINENPGLPVYAHADIFRPRYSRKKGEYKSIGMVLGREEVSGQSELHLSTQAEEILPCLWTTGDIHERSELEGRSAHHFVKDESAYTPDPYKDDMSLVLEGPNGLILICGCCHAGLLNTLAQVKRDFKKPLRAVIGGTHLLLFDGHSLRHVIEVLDDQFPHTHYFLNHCTGEHAIKKLKKVFGVRVMACPAGTVIDLDPFL